MIDDSRVRINLRWCGGEGERRKRANVRFDSRLGRSVDVEEIVPRLTSSLK